MSFESVLLGGIGVLVSLLGSASLLLSCFYGLNSYGGLSVPDGYGFGSSQIFW